MPEQKCGKCGKMVYPMEKLNCLDKIWHKACFRCEVCNMTLNMKNYKGFNKMPYCNAHYPQQKFTSVADTPESRRLAKLSENQSMLKYHQDFESGKGKKISVADDPETARIRKNTEIQSQATYHGLREQKDFMEAQRPPGEEGNAGPGGHNMGPPKEYDPLKDLETVTAGIQLPPQQRPVGSIQDYRPPAEPQPPQQLPRMQQQQQQPPRMQQQQQQQPPRMHQQQPPVAPASYNNVRKMDPPHQAPATAYPASSYQQPEPPRQPDPIPDLYSASYVPPEPNLYEVEPQPDPEPARSYSPQYYQEEVHQAPPSHYREPSPPPAETQMDPYGYDPYSQPSVHDQYREPPKQQQPPPQKSRICRAMYDYVAADSDEISFYEGDLIINCESIDEGWMTGTVERSGETGMLPSNYVEPV